MTQIKNQSKKRISDRLYNYTICLLINFHLGMSSQMTANVINLIWLLVRFLWKRTVQKIESSLKIFHNVQSDCCNKDKFFSFSWQTKLLQCSDTIQEGHIHSTTPHWGQKYTLTERHLNSHLPKREKQYWVCPTVGNEIPGTVETKKELENF